MRGVKQTIEGNDGESVMEIAVKNGLAGILADWAGSMSALPDHVHVAADWMDRVRPPSAEEVSMLEMAIDPDAT